MVKKVFTTTMRQDEQEKTPLDADYEAPVKRTRSKSKRSLTHSEQVAARKKRLRGEVD